MVASRGPAFPPKAGSRDAASLQSRGSRRCRASHQRSAAVAWQALKAAAPALTDEEIAAKADAVFSTAKIKITKDGQTGALMLISTGQLKKLAQYALDNEALDKKELTKLFKGEQSLDLALFGRMVADNPELNVEGSAQVAHAISTARNRPGV